MIDRLSTLFGRKIPDSLTERWDSEKDGHGFLHVESLNMPRELIDKYTMKKIKEHAVLYAEENDGVAIEDGFYVWFPYWFSKEALAASRAFMMQMLNLIYRDQAERMVKERFKIPIDLGAKEIVSFWIREGILIEVGNEQVRVNPDLFVFSKDEIFEQCMTSGICEQGHLLFTTRLSEHELDEEIKRRNLIPVDNYVILKDKFRVNYLTPSKFSEKPEPKNFITPKGLATLVGIPEDTAGKICDLFAEDKILVKFGQGENVSYNLGELDKEDMDFLVEETNKEIGKLKEKREKGESKLKTLEDNATKAKKDKLNAEKEAGNLKKDAYSAIVAELQLRQILDEHGRRE